MHGIQKTEICFTSFQNSGYEIMEKLKERWKGKKLPNNKSNLAANLFTQGNAASQKCSLIIKAAICQRYFNLDAGIE